MSSGMATVIGALIGVLGTLVLQRYVLHQKAHELFLTSLEHLGGGSQERSLGISALEFYWNDYKNERKLIIPILVGAAIYLLTESKQEDAEHERYNLKRIMHLLLERYRTNSLHSVDSSEIECFRDLRRALYMWGPDKRAIMDEKKKIKIYRGLKIDKEIVEDWKKKLEAKFPVLREQEGIKIS
jgi:hypothetical protein